MPLAFRSLSHGIVPFGFFNVAIDMILIADHFVFASDFCTWVEGWTIGAADHGDVRPFWVIEGRALVGDLHGAMRGDDLSGFIGSTYVRFPFPRDEADFKQDPDGYLHQDWVQEVVERFAGPARPVSVGVDQERRTIAIGPYIFDRDGFAALLHYLWRGGMPCWRDGVRPAYVEAMMDAARGSTHWLFAGRAWPE